MVFIPFRLRNQKWDTYHLSGTQLWLARPCVFVRAESMPKAAKAGLGRSHGDELVQRTLDGSVQRPSEADRARPAATVPAQANRRKKRKATGSAGEPPAAAARSPTHRCCPRPQQPAASCDSRTVRRTRPAPDWQLVYHVGGPIPWRHRTPEQTAPPGRRRFACRAAAAAAAMG